MIDDDDDDWFIDYFGDNDNHGHGYRLSYYIFCSALRLATCIEAAGKGKITIEGRLETNILIVKVFKI